MKTPEKMRSTVRSDLMWEEEKKRIEKLRWWDEVAGKHGFPADIKVWHVHPLAWVENFGSLKPRLITVELIEKVTGKTGPWFMGAGSKASQFLKDYDQYCSHIKAFDKETFVAMLNEALERYNIVDPYYQAHFLAQSFHESARFDSTLEYADGKDYDPGHSDALARGNTTVGDGPKYRGRGIIQLTWKNTYRDYGKHVGKDFVNDPWLIASDMYNAIDSACWFWRNKGAISQKFNAKGDVNIIIANDRDNVTLVTTSVNGSGKKHLKERMELYKAIKIELGLEPGAH
jgi:predicted chitinase